MGSVVSACEDETLTIKCDHPHQHLSITFANYGWTIESAAACPNCEGPVYTLLCVLFDTEEIVQGICPTETEQLRECSILASNSVFGDPCVDTRKILYVEYTCVPDKIS